MSHEIRTPLTSILGFAEATGEEIRGAGRPEELNLESLRRFSELIEEGGRRLLETLNAVLNLSKLEAGQMRLEAEPVDLAKQARQVVQEHRTQAEEKGLELQTRLPGSPTWAEADEGGVQIVLQNLLSNAIKYTEEGSIEVRTYLEGEEAAVLEVEDTGIGMDPELAEGLFEPFRQASEGVSREYEGTGVGLAVTREAAEKMGGSVEVDTQKGEGSRFTVRLPRASLAG
jgi:PAS/PAC sensor signal transduction histidine kinase (EC 2.7.13.3)